jgi:hypothetical protein
MMGAHRMRGSLASWLTPTLEDPMTTPTTTTQKKHHVDSEQGMMILLLVIVAISVIGVVLVGA